MFKLGEKVVFELSSVHFDLKGVNGYYKEDKKLFVTNLGNIVIGEGNQVEDLEGVVYTYSFSEHKRKLTSYLEGGKILVEGKDLPIEIEQGDKNKSAKGNLRIVLSVSEYESIGANQREFIFEIKDGATMLSMDETKTYIGGINFDHEKIVFIGGKNRLDIYYSDVERVIEENNYATFKGYFYIEREGVVARTITIFNDDIKKCIPEDLEQIVRDNRKIGNLPKEALVVFCKATGEIDGKVYKNTNALMVKYEDQMILINKRTKEHIMSTSLDKIRKLNMKKDIVMYDGKNIFYVTINEANSSIMKLSELKDIREEKIGFTLDKKPVLIEQSGDYIKIAISQSTNLICIKNDNVVDMIVDSNSEMPSQGFVKTSILFGNEKISLFLKKNMATNLIKDIYTLVKEPMVESTSTEVIVENWARATNDIAVYDFFANMYNAREKIASSLSLEINDEKRVELANEIYSTLQEQKNDLDMLSAYFIKSIESQVMMISNNIGIKFDRELFYRHRRSLTYITDKLYRDIDRIEDSIDKVIFVISIEGSKKYNYRLLKEVDSDRLDSFLRQSKKRMDHLVFDMYPYYIHELSECIKHLFEDVKKYCYELENVNIIDDTEKKSEIKKMIFGKINEIYVFKQLPINDDSNFMRKDMIKELYSLLENGTKNLDATKFFIGNEIDISKSSLWGGVYEFVDLSDDNIEVVQSIVDVNLDEIISSILIEEKEDHFNVDDDVSILDELITEMDIDEELDIDMVYQEMDANIDDLDHDFADLEFDLDIDDDIKVLIDDI
ncbi:MAG: hypothetical protein LBN09_01990 [Clostridioides sp.]|nr:hypothetical protein [Clostridioides sp.]